MQRNHQWLGPGQGYDMIDTGDPIVTANMRGRQGVSPTSTFRFKHTIGNVYSPGASNSGDHRVQWGATETADEISRRENFKF